MPIESLHELVAAEQKKRLEQECQQLLQKATKKFRDALSEFMEQTQAEMFHMLNRALRQVSEDSKENYNLVLARLGMSDDSGDAVASMDLKKIDNILFPTQPVGDNNEADDELSVPFETRDPVQSLRDQFGACNMAAWKRLFSRHAVLEDAHSKLDQQSPDVKAALLIVHDNKKLLRPDSTASVLLHQAWNKLVAAFKNLVEKLKPSSVVVAPAPSVSGGAGLFVAATKLQRAAGALQRARPASPPPPR